MRRRHSEQPVDAERFTEVMRNLIDRRILDAPEYRDLLPLTQLDPADVERRMQTLTPSERAELERVFPWLERTVRVRLGLERAIPFVSRLHDLVLWLVILDIGFDVVLLFCVYALPAWQIPQPFVTPLIVAVSLIVLAACYITGRTVSKFFRPKAPVKGR